MLDSCVGTSLYPCYLQFLPVPVYRIIFTSFFDGRTVTSKLIENFNGRSIPLGRYGSRQIVTQSPGLKKKKKRQDEIAFYFLHNMLQNNLELKTIKQLNFLIIKSQKYIKVARKTYNKTSYMNHLASKTIHAWLILLYLYSHPSSLWSDCIYRKFNIYW